MYAIRHSNGAHVFQINEIHFNVCRVEKKTVKLFEWIAGAMGWNDMHLMAEYEWN